MALFAKHVEETHRTRLELRVGQPKLGQALLDETAHLARLADATHVALHVGHEARHTYLAERLGQHLQRHGLARACRASYQTMTVGHLTHYANRPAGTMGDIKPSLFAIHIRLLF